MLVVKMTASITTISKTPTTSIQSFMQHVPWSAFHPNHDTAKAQAKGFNGMVTFCVKGSRDNVKKFFFKALTVMVLPLLVSAEQHQHHLLNYNCKGFLGYIKSVKMYSKFLIVKDCTTTHEIRGRISSSAHPICAGLIQVFFNMLLLRFRTIDTSSMYCV